MYHSILTTPAAYFLFSHVLVAIPLPSTHGPTRLSPLIEARASLSITRQISIAPKMQHSTAYRYRLKLSQLSLTSCNRKLALVAVLKAIVIKKLYVFYSLRRTLTNN
jgi:hypothetical protein